MPSNSLASAQKRRKRHLARSLLRRRIKDVVLHSRQRWLESYPTILVSLFLILSVWLIFGVNYIIIPPVLILVFRQRHTQEFSLRGLLRTYCILLLVCLAAFLATINLPLCALLNLAVPFLVVGLLSDKFNPKSYFVYGMEFVFFQMTPVPLSHLAMELVVMLYGFCMVTLFLWLHSRRIRKKRDYATIRRGLELLSLEMEKLANGEDISQERDAFPPMMAHMSRVVYSSRNFSYLADDYGKINYWCMLLFQRFHYFVSTFYSSRRSLLEGEKRFYHQLSGLLGQAARGFNQPGRRMLVRSICSFARLNRLPCMEEEDAIQEILRLLEFCLMQREKAYFYRTRLKKEGNWRVPEKKDGEARWKQYFQWDQFQVRFALRLAVVLCVTFSFCKITGWEHAYWYPMTTFLMLMPYAEESLLKINNRILGTVAGLAVSFVMMSLVHSMGGRVLVVVLMTCLMYYAPVTSWTMPMYATCYAMAISTLYLNLDAAILLRLVYVLLAAATTFLANRFLLPNTAKTEFRKTVRQLFDIDLEIVGLIRTDAGKREALNQFRDLMVQSNLVSEEITKSLKNDLKPEEREYYSQMLPLHQKLVEEMEQMYSYLYHRQNRFDRRDNVMLTQFLDNLSDSIRRIRLGYTSRELTPFLDPGKTAKPFGKLEDKLYFNTLTMQCMESVDKLTALSNYVGKTELQKKFGKY